MSKSINKITRSIRPGSVFESAQAVTSPTVSYNQGDLLIFDTVAHVIRPAASEAEGATFLGISRESVINGRIPSFPQDPQLPTGGIADLPGPQYGVVARIALKTGDTLNPGDLVYLDTASGPSNVTATGTKGIGVYQGRPISSAPAGTLVEVLLGHRFPTDDLRF